MLNRFARRGWASTLFVCTDGSVPRQCLLVGLNANLQLCHQFWRTSHNEEIVFYAFER